MIYTDSIVSPNRQLDQRKTQPRASGPMSRILSTNGPLVIVYGGDSGDRDNTYRELALRMAYDLHLYQGLDVKVQHHQAALQALHGGYLGTGNIITIGHPRLNLLTRWMLERQNGSSQSKGPSGGMKC